MKPADEWDLAIGNAMCTSASMAVFKKLADRRALPPGMDLLTHGPDPSIAMSSTFNPRRAGRSPMVLITSSASFTG